MDIIEFLRARLDEEEEKARKAIALRESTPLANPDLNTRPDYDLEAWEDIGVPTMLIGPERVMREVEAKRALVDEHGSTGEKWVGFPRADKRITYCRGCEQEVPCFTLGTLADIYANHRDYDPDWAT